MNDTEFSHMVTGVASAIITHLEKRKTGTGLSEIDAIFLNEELELRAVNRMRKSLRSSL